MKLTLKFLFTVIIGQHLLSQTTVSGYIKDTNQNPIGWAIVSLDKDLNNTITTDPKGYFEFQNVTQGEFTIVISKEGFMPQVINLSIIPSEDIKNLGDITLEYQPLEAENLISLTDEELTTDDGGSLGQVGIGLLQSSRDVFSKVAAYELGAYWFNIRGTDNRYNNVMIDGVPMAKNHSGRPDFSNWGGLNNSFRYTHELAETNNVSDYSFSNLGGTYYYDTRASSYRKGLNLSYSLTNKTYQHRLMVSYATGMLPSGWAFAFNASRRWMEEGVIDGTFNDSYAYFVSVEKKISENHRLNFTTFGTPTRRSGASPNTQEVYDLRGKNYNAYWGWQEGQRRNERIKKMFEPVFMLTYDWNINKNTKITTTASYQTGYQKSSRLNWYNSTNPSPTYYRNLPSYIQYLIAKANGSPTESLEAAYQEILNRWQEIDTSITQINWGSLYEANYNAPFVTDLYSGEQGRRASYFLVNDVIKDRTFNASAHLQTQFADHWKFYINLNYQNLMSDNYREVEDLLGADFALNRSSFLQGDAGDYNILKPNSIAKEGDKLEYNYKLHKQAVTANATTRLYVDHWNLAASFLLGWNESYRNGMFQNGLYADNSYGRSSKENFIDVGLRGGITYKIDGRNFIILNSGYFLVSPTLNEIFANPRLNNMVTPDLTNQKVGTSDITYTLRSPKIKLRATAYYTRIKDAVEISRFYAQGLDLSQYLPSQGSVSQDATSSNVFLSEILTGVDKEYMGTELGLELKISPTITTFAVASVGQYVYKNNPNLKILTDNYEGMPDLGSANIKNYKIAGSPQKGYSLGFRYNSPKYWWIGVSGNLLQDIYSDISALSRTENFIINPESQQPYANATNQSVKSLLKQKKYEDAWVFNANIGKSFRIGKYYMGVSLSVNNIFNERGLVSGSFEQGRYANYEQLSFDHSLTTPLFGDKLFYDRGRSYFVNISFKL